MKRYESPSIIKEDKQSVEERSYDISEVDQRDIKYMIQHKIIDVATPIYLADKEGRKVVVLDSTGSIDKIPEINKVIAPITDWDVNDLMFGKNKKYPMFLIS